MKISVFKSLHNTKDTPFEQDIIDVYTRIKEGYPELIEKITKIRNSKKGDPDFDETKKSLRAVMFNGTFTERNDNGLLQHSGLCILDFDDYPSAEVMDAERQRLEACPYTYLLFISPSGNGLKCVIKIPPSDKFTHKRRFKAFQEFIDSDYFDTSSCNVSRVCFESYDPTIYINPDAELFTLIEEEKGHSKLEVVPILPIKSENKIIEIIMKWDHGNFSTGSRNLWVFKVASCLCEYGINFNTAVQELNQYSAVDFPESEILRTVQSAYKSIAMPGMKFFEDKETVNKVKLKLKEGISTEDITNQLDVKPEVIKDIQKDLINSEDTFWKIEDKGKNKIVTIDPKAYQIFLMKHGFQKYYPEAANKFTFVRVQENKVSLSSIDKIKDFVLNYLDNKGLIDVWNYCSKSPYLFTDGHINMITSINLMMLQDTKDMSFIPYRNGVVKITKDKIDLIPYIDIDGYVWDSHILQRNYYYEAYNNNDFKDFIYQVSARNDDRVMSLETTLGFLLHTYKDMSEQKAIIFNDQEIDDNPNGGSGKSLVLTAISKIRNLVKIDGKAFNPQKSDFVYQRVNVDSQVLAFDDVKKNFDFEQLFSLISEGITVNRKNKDEIFIPFERSPKIVITTNYVINGAGGSHDRRRHEIEFFQYFNAHNTPEDIYKKLFFKQWDNTEWASFDSYMINCLQKFLKHRLIKSVAINNNDKKLISATNKDFWEFVTENEGIVLDHWYTNADILRNFQEDSGSHRDLDTKTLLKWIKEWCKQNNYKYENGAKNIGRGFKVLKFSKDDIVPVLEKNNIIVTKPVKKQTYEDLWDGLNAEAEELWKK